MYFAETRVSFLLQDAAARLIENLVERLEGPMAFRFAVQPLMAVLVAIRDGIRDARTGAPPYLLAILRPSGSRTAALLEGVRATARILIMAAVLDVIYQVWFFRVFYLGEMGIVAILLAWIPYTLLRGPVCRIARMGQA